MIRFIAISLLIISTTSCTSESVCVNDFNEVFPTIQATQIDSIIGDKFNGVVYIERNGILLFSKAFGYSNIEEQIPLKTEDPFVIGSISKQITAALILKDLEAGYINLNDPIGKYLNTLQMPWKDSVSIHQLLVHTSGILSRNEKLKHPPGAEFHYSQFGYQLLAEIIESVHHNSFENVANLFFEAKGLKHTHFPTFKQNEHVHAYINDTSGKVTQTKESLENYPAAGAFISTANDLAKWNSLLYRFKIVSKENLDLMSKHHETREHPIFGTLNYGYGLTFLEQEENLCIGALGYAPGFVSANFYYPETRTSLIVLSNKADGIPDFNLVFDKQIQLIEFLKKD